MTRMRGKVSSREGRSDSANAWSMSPEARQLMIGEAAYYRYVQRGYASGQELDDWLAAEADFERASFRRQAPEPDTNPEFELQQSGTVGPAEDEALKRAIKQHPRRDIPRIEGVEPEDAPLKE